MHSQKCPVYICKPCMPHSQMQNAAGTFTEDLQAVGLCKHVHLISPVYTCTLYMHLAQYYTRTPCRSRLHVHACYSSLHCIRRSLITSTHNRRCYAYPHAAVLFTHEHTVLFTHAKTVLFIHASCACAN